MDKQKVKDILAQAVDEMVIHGNVPQDAVRLLRTKLPGMDAPVMVLVIGENSHDAGLVAITNSSDC